jgi:hypothetical protein
MVDAPVGQTEKVVSTVELMYSIRSKLRCHEYPIGTASASARQLSLPRDDNFGNVSLAALGPGQWYGEREIFLRTAPEEDAFAEGEVILWTTPPDPLRDLFSASPASLELLYNFGVRLAQKLSVKAQVESPMSTVAASN